MTARTTHLLYLHGFRSSPRSTKAQRMAREVEALRGAGCDITWWCPQLPPSPARAMREVMADMAGWPRDTTAVMGSSLGGFYATAVAEALGCPAVLVNPAVEPARDLAAYIGEQTTWQDPAEHFHFRAEFIDELKALRPSAITRPERYFAVIAKGDEVLDWREMSARYEQCRVKLLEGGDHALSDFDTHLPEVLAFLGLNRS